MLGVFRSLFFFEKAFLKPLNDHDHENKPKLSRSLAILRSTMSFIHCMLSLLSIVHWSGLTTIRLKLLLMCCLPTNLLQWGRSPPPLLEMAFLLQFSHRPSFWNDMEHCQLLSGFSSRLTKSVLLHLNWPSLYIKVFQLHASIPGRVCSLWPALGPVHETQELRLIFRSKLTQSRTLALFWLEMRK